MDEVLEALLQNADSHSAQDATAKMLFYRMLLAQKALDAGQEVEHLLIDAGGTLISLLRQMRAGKQRRNQGKLL
ncbi:MAG: hypothetical protein Q8N65_00530 [bacterium]|nr:hypothetical protein [bacterium]